LWVERATGVEYWLVRGNPLLGFATEASGSEAECFVVAADRLWFLRRADRPEGRSIEVGSVGVAS
jgi:hypothetical protein